MPTDYRAKLLNKKHHTAILCAMIFFIILIIGNSIIMDENTSGNAISTGNSQPTHKINTVETATEPPTISSEDYINLASTIPYDDLIREPDKYIGEIIKITVEVYQLFEGSMDFESGYMGNGLNNELKFKDEWYIKYDIPDDVPRIIKDDAVTFYGKYRGVITMIDALTKTEEYIPGLIAEYHVVN